MKDPVCERVFADSIHRLIADIHRYFPPARLESPGDLAPPYVDQLKYGGLLAGKAWSEVSTEDFQRLDSMGVQVALTAKGLGCYLPMFMTRILERRTFGWFEEALLPIGVGLEDVVGYFSGYCLDDLDNSFRDRYRARILYVRSSLTSVQRECVSRYIDIATRYRLRCKSDAEFELMLRKYRSFWYDAS